MAEAHEKIDQLQRQNDELNLIKERYEKLIFAVENKHPDESRHETALRYIRQAENRGHQPCGAGKSERQSNGSNGE
jgi:predicted  nucleic acid-binding Zn-ribbon protein